MNLYLIQHGEAENEQIDPKRPLTLKGKNDLLKIAGFLRQAGVKIDEIWHSGKLRAEQTGQIIAQELGLKNIQSKEGLKPNDPVDVISTMLADDRKSVMLASHLPFLQKLACRLLTGREDKELVKFTPGTIAFLEQGAFGWQIVWLVKPEII